MIHKGTESRRKKSLVLNQALILHEKWQSFGLDSWLIFLLTTVPEMFWGTYLHHFSLESQQGPRAGSNSTRVPGASAAQGCPASTPTVLGLPQAQDVWMKSRANSKLLQSLWDTCKWEWWSVLSAPDCEGWLQVTALVRGCESLKPHLASEHL